MGHVTLTTPISGMARRLGLATVNLLTEVEVSNSTRYEDIKSGGKCGNGGGL